MAAYLVASVHIHHPQSYEEYRSRTQPIIEAHGGRFLVRGGTVHPLEGAQDIERFVLIEFASVEAARTFYDSADYQGILPARPTTPPPTCSSSKESRRHPQPFVGMSKSRVAERRPYY